MKFEYTQSKLNNEMRVVTVPMSVPTVTVLVMVRVGSRDEGKRVSGISHFVEHLVFKGTKKYPTSQAVASAVDAVGAAFNAFTSKEYTGFYVKAASEYLELALDVLSQFLFEAKLRAEDIEREKGVIVEEINMYEDTPMRRVGDLYDQLAYKGHPLGRDIIGTKESVTHVTREDFVRHMEQWYGSKNIVLGVAGDASKLKTNSENARKLISKYFDLDRKRNDPVRTGGKFTTKQRKPQVRVQYKKTEQAHFALGVRTLPRGHKDRYVQTVLSTILGGNMSSRLFSEVREKRGLAYYIRTGAAAYRETGHMVTQAGVTIGKIEEAIKAVIEQYQNVSKKSNVSQKELKEAKDYLKGKLLIELEDSQDVVSMFTDSLLLEEKVRTPQEVIEGVEKVTQEDVVRLAKRIFVSKGLNLVVLGPYRDEKRFSKLLS